MSIEAMKQALEALETGWPVVADVFRVDHVMKYEAAITALRTAIEQAEQEQKQKEQKDGAA